MIDPGRWANESFPPGGREPAHRAIRPAWPARRRTRRRLSAGLAMAVATLTTCVVVGSGTGRVLAAQPGSAGLAEQAVARSRLQTPVLSLRRIGTGLLDLRAGNILDTTIDAALSAPALEGAEPCLVVTSGGRSLYSTRVSEQMIPASTIKLLTGSAAFTALGQEHTFTTTVTASAKPVAGAVSGDLSLVGGGDPILQTATYNAGLGVKKDLFTSLDALADRVAAAGVTSVQGSVVGDESRYDSQRSIPTWKPRYLADGEVGPLSALMVNQGMNPKPVADPVTFAAATFTTLLQARGITVTGPPRAAPPARGAAVLPPATVASIKSPPLRDIVGEMLRVSDNTTAELLVKEIGLAGPGRQGTTVVGAAQVRSVLAGAGFDVSRLVNVDGSGLDRGNRVTCDLIADVVGRAGRQSVLAANLPVSGVTGTLRKRLVGTEAAGRVLAKTGSLDGVSALAGWVDPKPGAVAPPLLFAFVANDLPNGSIGPTIGDKVSLTLATWPDVPAAATVAPLPLLASGVG